MCLMYSPCYSHFRLSPQCGAIRASPSSAVYEWDTRGQQRATTYVPIAVHYGSAGDRYSSLHAAACFLLKNKIKTLDSVSPDFL